MKRKDLIRQLVDAGCYLKRHGKKHDLYENPTKGMNKSAVNSKKEPQDEPHKKKDLHQIDVSP